MTAATLFGRPRWRPVAALIILATLVTLLPGCAPSQSQSDAWPTAGWRSTTPEEQGLDSVRLADALLTLRDKVNLHSLLIIRHGKVVADAYFYPYDGRAPHDLSSVTKSIMTTLIGIAVDQGKLKLDDPLLSFFPDATLANRSADMENLTVRHLVMMANGLESVGMAQDEGTLTQAGFHRRGQAQGVRNEHSMFAGVYDAIRKVSYGTAGIPSPPLVMPTAHHSGRRWMRASSGTGKNHDMLARNRGCG